MSTSLPVLPQQITPAMIPFVASEDIFLHAIVCLDPGAALDTPAVLLQDNAATPPILPAIGLACNDAIAGETVYVAVWGTRRIEGASIGVGTFVGTDLTLSGPGQPEAIATGLDLTDLTAACSLVGVCTEADATGAVVLIQPWCFLPPAAAGGVTSFKGRTGVVVPAANDYTASQIAGLRSAIVPTTFNTNADYDLPENPNPLSSLQVFINSEAIPKPGQDRLLVQGTDYSLVAGAHGANARIHYLVTPTATNSIVCWYTV